MGYKKVRTEEFLGRLCDVWVHEQLGTTEWVCKGVTVKTLSDKNDVSIVATKWSETFDKEKKLQRPDIEWEEIKR